MSNMNASWRGFWALCPKVITVVKVLLMIVVLDLATSIGLSFFIPDSFYFKKYMGGAQGAEKGYEEIISDYYNNKTDIQPNLETGWFNAPNYKKENDKWVWISDSYGSRVPIVQENIETSSDILEGDSLVFILGSSIMQGFELPYEQAPVNHLNNSGYNAFDFTSVTYSVDQSFALYKNILSKHKPKVLVVGVHNDPDAISNMFAFFNVHGSVPFLKPAYYLADNEAVKIEPPAKHQQRNELSLMLSTLKKHDSHYYKFELYKRLVLLPFSDFLRRIILKIDKDILGVDKYIKAFELQEYFMRRLTDLAKNNGAEVIFIKLESLDDLEKPFYTKFYKDKNTIHTELLKSTSMNILYISEMFKKTGRPLSEFYFESDRLHLTADASELLAQKIDQKIKKIRFVGTD